MALAVALLAASCGSRPVYSHFEAVDQQGWDRQDTLRFVIPLKKAATYDLRIDLRTNSHYPYTQLALNAWLQSRGQEQRTAIRFDITDADGNIQGRGTGVYQYSAMLPAMTTTRRDTLTVSVYHAMSREVLPGIVDLGITAEPANASNR